MTHFYKKFLLAACALLLLNDTGFSMQPTQGQIVPSKGTAMTTYNPRTNTGTVLANVLRGRAHTQVDGEAISSRIFRQSIQAIFKKTIPGAQMPLQEEQRIQNTLAQFWNISSPETSHFKKMCDALGQEILELVTVQAQGGLIPKDVSLIDLAINEYLKGVYFLANPGRLYKIGRGGHAKSISSMTLEELNQFFHLLPAKTAEQLGQFYKVKTGATTGQKTATVRYLFTEKFKNSLVHSIFGMEQAKVIKPHSYIHIGGVSFYHLLNQLFPNDGGKLAAWVDHLSKRPWFVTLDVLGRVLHSFWQEKNYLPMPSLSALTRQIILGKYDGIDLTRFFREDDQDYMMLISTLNLIGKASYTLAYNELSTGGNVPQSKSVLKHAIQNNLGYFFEDIEKNKHAYATPQDLQNDLRHRLGAFSITLLSLWAYEHGKMPGDSDCVDIKDMLTRYIQKTEAGCQAVLDGAGGSKATLQQNNQSAYFHYCKVEPWLKSQDVKKLLNDNLTAKSLQNYNRAMKSVLWTEPPIYTQQASPQQLQITTGGQTQNTPPIQPQQTAATGAGSSSGTMKRGAPPPPPPPFPQGGMGAALINRAATSAGTPATQKATPNNRPDLGNLGDALTRQKAGLRNTSQTPPLQQTPSNLPPQEKTLLQTLADALAKNRMDIAHGGDEESDEESEDDWSD